MKLSSLAVACALVLGTGAIAFAQAPQGAPSGGGRGAMRAACGADIQANCAGKQGREIRQCLMDNQAKLSDACKAAMANMPGRGGR